MFENGMVVGLYQKNDKVLVFPITNRGRRALISLMIGYTRVGSLYTYKGLTFSISSRTQGQDD
jgi:hypothetical protein